jgi:hypothetical protein
LTVPSFPTISVQMRRRSLAAVLAALLIVCAAPSAGWADGDPASDVLLGENVFYPYQPIVSATLMRELNGATAEAAKAGAPVKVALIASPIDLGVIPSLFGKPQEYADYLDEEISFTGPAPLLVVMADGYGTKSLKPAATAAIAHLALPDGKTSDDLATAALTAVDKIAAAEGHPISSSGSAAAGASSGSSSTAIIVILLVAAALATAGAIAVITLRRRRSPA